MNQLNEHKEDLSLDTNGAAPASSINQPGSTVPLTLGDILKDIEHVFGEDIDFIKGMSKNSKPKFNLVEYLKSFNHIIRDHIIKKNKDLSPEQAFIIKTYFDSMLHFYDILGCIDIKVAETELLSYTTGYNIQSLKKYYDRYRKVQEPEG